MIGLRAILRDFWLTELDNGDLGLFGFERCSASISVRDQTLMSALAWIDFDQTDRDRARRIMDLFGVEDSRDELGLGSIRGKRCVRPVVSV